MFTRKLSPWLALLGAVLEVRAQETETRSLSIAQTKPTDAIVVPKDFVSFGIEAAYLNNYANEFSENLVASVGARMGAPLVLRIGGTSGDLFHYDPTLTDVDKVCVAECQGSSHKAEFNVGPKYFEGYTWHAGAKMTIQAPIEHKNGDSVNASNAVAFVWHAYQALGADRTDAIALGNEPEWFDTLQAYIDGALRIQDAVVKNLTLSGAAAKVFEVGNTASENTQGDSKYNVKDILEGNINANGLVKAAAEHYYQTPLLDNWNDTVLQRRVLNHNAIAVRLDSYPSINATRKAGLKYVINEDAAVLGGAPIQFSGGFGYALWAVDFNLAAMSRGVARVSNLAGRPSAKRVFWVPDDSASDTNTPAQARAPFAAAPFVADFVGNSSDPSAVVELTVEGNHLSAYAMYNGASGSLDRVALVNLRLWNGTAAGEGGERPSLRYMVPVGEGVSEVKVRALHADRGVAAMGFDYGGESHNVTWGGEQWSRKIDNGKGHFAAGAGVETSVPVTDGVAAVDVPDSEAVIVYVGA